MPPRAPASTHTGGVSGGEDALDAMVVVQRQSDLLQVVGTLGPSRCLPGPLDGRQQKRDQQGDDRDDDQQLDQGEAAGMMASKNFAHGISPARSSRATERLNGRGNRLALQLDDPDRSTGSITPQAWASISA